MDFDRDDRVSDGPALAMPLLWSSQLPIPILYCHKRSSNESIFVAISVVVVAVL